MAGAAPERILFLMAEVVRAQFSDPGERRWRLLAAYLLLAGKGRATKADQAKVDAELAR